MARTKISVWNPPATIYQRRAHEAHGYAPSDRSRFGVVRRAPDAPWLLVHRRSGSGISSLLPARRAPYTLAEQLAVCSALDAATHLDWAPFDELPEATAGTLGYPQLSQAGLALAGEMRRIVAQAVAS